MLAIKRKILIALVVGLCIHIGMFNIIGTAENINLQQSDNYETSPYNVAIIKRDYAFSINNTGNASCYGKASVLPGYTVKLVMQLQKKANM